MRTDALHAYAQAFEDLQPDKLNMLGVLLADDVRFSDPFNNVVGRRNMLAVFEHMYRTLDEPSFSVLDVAEGDSAAYLRWVMTGVTRSGAVLNVQGMSEVHIDAAGKVEAHIDHWDSLSQLFTRLPRIGWIARRVLRTLAVKA